MYRQLLILCICCFFPNSLFGQGFITDVSKSGTIDTIVGFNRAGQTITADTSGLTFNVPSGDEFQFVTSSGTAITISNDALQFKSYTDAGRPAASIGAGFVIFNSDDGGLNVSDGSNWRAPSGGWVNT